METPEAIFKLIDIAVSLFILAGVLYFGYKEFRAQRTDFVQKLENQRVEFLKKIDEKDKIIGQKDADLLEQLKSAYEVLNLFSQSVNKLETGDKQSVEGIRKLHEMTDRRLITIGRKLNIEDSGYYGQ
jgi:predicted negative regulator of RcsB-dependent stress response